jgi:hypothetical protein
MTTVWWWWRGLASLCMPLVWCCSTACSSSSRATRSSNASRRRSPMRAASCGENTSRGRAGGSASRCCAVWCWLASCTIGDRTGDLSFRTAALLTLRVRSLIEQCPHLARLHRADHGRSDLLCMLPAAADAGRAVYVRPLDRGTVVPLTRSPLDRGTVVPLTRSSEDSPNDGPTCDQSPPPPAS